jgi:prevent-host-death family protein
MDIWKLQDAKARFSEVVDRALHDGPQVVTRHGENTVVIVAYREFAGAESVQDFKDFLMSIPRVGLDIKPSRRRPRHTEL